MKNRSIHLPDNLTRAGFAFFTLLFALFVVSGQEVGATVITTLSNSVAGSYTWLCPAGVTSVQIECWGAGGAGGHIATNAAGGGGAGGAYARASTYAVTPGTTYFYQVGAGGASDAISNNIPGNDGGDSWFSNSTPAVVVLAKGGGGGGGAAPFTGGIGGICPDGSIGIDGTYIGGSGGNGVPNPSTPPGGGGGGGSAVFGSVGNNATGKPGGAALLGGGAGGNGGQAANGNPGTIPGGGGGGGHSNAGAHKNNGAGAAGQVVLTYAVPFNALDWIGDGGNNFWSTNTGNICWDSDANGSADLGFNDTDIVTFGAAGAANPTVTLQTRVAPTSLAVNSTSDYTFTGSGKISGATSLTQSGVGNLTISTANDYSGGTAIGAGRVRLGNDNVLGTGPITLSGGALSSDSGTARTLTNAIAITSSNTVFGDLTDNGVLTTSSRVTMLAAKMTMNSDVVFAGGLTNSGNPSYTKAGPGTLILRGTTVSSNAFDATLGVLLIDGSGTTVNISGRISANAGAGNVARVILTNGAILMRNETAANFRPGFTAGGSDYFDLAGLCTMPNVDGNNGKITFNGTSTLTEFNLLPKGDIAVRAVTNELIGSGLTRFNFNGGILRAISNNTTFFENLLTEANVQAGGANLDDGGFAIVLNQPLLAGTPSGGLNKIGLGILTLGGAETYTGNTVISNGTLLVNGSLAAGVNVKSGATLGGSGTIGGNVTLTAGALATNNQGSPLTLTGALIASGNTLNVATPSALDLGDYPLMTYNTSGSSGTFNSTPNISGAGLAANTAGTIVTSGGTVVLHVASGTASYSTNLSYAISGGTLTLTWPGTHLGWFAQSNSVNLADPNFWFDVSGSQLNTNLSITINPTSSKVFYRLRHP